MIRILNFYSPEIRFLALSNIYGVSKKNYSTLVKKSSYSCIGIGIYHFIIRNIQKYRESGIKRTANFFSFFTILDFDCDNNIIFINHTEGSKKF